ncbi:(5-formylfuran-3-yl)methyl phosphate synthase [Methylomonas paludis]|uniref:(5-formylfuran-3-yl)methyl phosphate synthase n=1 Tax=Methylomonas paludis TaxID=1173101 RepID=A0A975R8S9_9GAMM|nr:(5-formylfuran-3-yl)methyl phosphate synthase [Methylomonas paludis]QWF69499.1 (5-formylfuran-3-yl)methyl phosphate synthase [Methylomonas paludis]
MSYMLASVNSLAEALLVEQFEVDIIDLKQPARGALGALAAATVKQIVSHLPSGTLVSATIGDLPMLPAVLAAATLEMAQTGVDYVKIGFFPDGDWPACINALSVAANQGHQLVAVLFADTRPDFGVIALLAAAGFRGVMLDTMDKQLGSLPQIVSAAELAEFVYLSKQAGLLCGLAGSLKLADISELLPLQADYLGFRGGLCHQSCRTAELDTSRIAAIKALLAEPVRSELCG